MLQVDIQDCSPLLVHVADVDITDTKTFFWFRDIFDLKLLLMTKDVLDKVLVDLREDVFQIQLVESDAARDYISRNKVDND